MLDKEAAVLSFVNKAGTVCYAFKLCPCLEYVGRAPAPAPAAWLRSDGDHHHVFRAQDGVVRAEIHAEIKQDAIDYWVEAAPVEPGAEVRTVHYGQDAPGHAHASAHRLEEFFIVCPDRYGTCIPKQAKVGFKLGALCFEFDKDNNFPHEGGRTILPPYFGALRTGTDWLGVGTLEVPASQYGLEMLFQDGRAVIDFTYGGSLTLNAPYTFPKITFFTGPDRLAVGRRYIDRLYEDGLAVPNEQWEPEWAGPIYCFFSDQMYEYQTDRDTEAMLGEMTMTENYCNDAFLQTCLDFLAEHAVPYRMVIIDYGWFVMNGEWRPNTARFKDFKATIRKLQQMGKKVLLWYAPYFNAEASTNFKSHPETAVMKRDGTPLVNIRFGTEVNYMSDFTHPAMRELCRRDLAYMLGPDGLNADGIKIDCTNRPPTVENVFHDPAWGTGELFHYKASKFIYDAAKTIKPNCCINATAGNPFFNRTFDLHRLHDGMEYNLDAYEERAWAAWFCRAGISDLDDWPSYDLFTVRANLRKIAYGAPSLYAVRKRGGERKYKASTGYSVTVGDEELELLAALYELHTRAPVDLSQAILIDPFRKIFHRKYTRGPLQGFYAATTLSGNQAVAVYEPDAARLVAIADIALAVPLPPQADEVRVRAVTRTGAPAGGPDFEVIDGHAVFEAKRCCGNVKWYEIGYRLARE